MAQEVHAVSEPGVLGVVLDGLELGAIALAPDPDEMGLDLIGALVDEPRHLHEECVAVDEQNPARVGLIYHRSTRSGRLRGGVY